MQSQSIGVHATSQGSQDRSAYYVMCVKAHFAARKIINHSNFSAASCHSTSDQTEWKPSMMKSTSEGDKSYSQIEKPI